MRTPDRGKPVHKKPWASLIAIAALVASVSARAGYVEGDDLNKMCNPDPSDACAFYVVGVWDTWAIWQAPDDPESRRRGSVCKPEGVGGVQLAAIVAKYLRERPESWHESAAFLIVAALAEAFPCE